MMDSFSKDDLTKLKVFQNKCLRLIREAFRNKIKKLGKFAKPQLTPTPFKIWDALYNILQD